MGLFSIGAVWFLKVYVFPHVISIDITFFETFKYEVRMPGIILASIGGLFARLGVKGMVESWLEEYSSKQLLSPSEVRGSILFKSNGEGSSSQDPTKGGAPTGGGAPTRGGVIGPEDFIYDSDTESKSSHSMNEDNNAVGDDVETFEQKVEKMTSKEGVSSVKETMNKALNIYKESGSNVPAFGEQVADLEEKIKICDSKISELEREEQTEGKGKEKEVTEGKGKEKEVTTGYPERGTPGHPDFPRTIMNPNYQPRAGRSYLWPVAEDPSEGKKTQNEDYSYDSEEEEEAIRRTIEESKKTESSREESSKEESSKSGKGKGKDE